MNSERPGLRERRLGAIMFTDVVGYTSISARNESRALELLDEYRAQLHSVFPRFEGRVVKTMGDGFLVEFASAVEAVNCAVEAQSVLGELNSKRPSEEAIRMRIGIHVGDIVHSEGDVLGDAVNVASRVEPLAEPGGICMTRQVVDQVQGKVDWQISSIGMKSLRNLPNPIEVFVVGGRHEQAAASKKQSLDSHRVAILPFSNLSPDPNDKYFADGLTEELISTISRIGDLSVISRGSAMKYRDTKLSLDQVGRELDAGAILEGSVRKAGNKVRIAAQLLEVDSDKYVWSQSYDRDLTDILDVQAEIAEQVAEGLKLKLLSRDRESLGKRSTQNSEAYTLYLKGRFYWNERTQEATKKAVRYFEEAVKLDPRFAMAYSGLADCHLIMADYGWSAPAAAGDLAKGYALKALQLDEGLAEAHASLGLVSINHYWDFVAGEKELRAAIGLNPNLAQAYHWYGVMLMFTKRFREAEAMVRKGLELDPYSPVLAQSLAVSFVGLGEYNEALTRFRKLEAEGSLAASVNFWTTQVLIAQSKFEEAIVEGRKEVAANGGDLGAKLDLAVALGLAGKEDEAGAIIEEGLSPNGSYRSPTSLGSALLAAGRDDEAYGWLEKAYAEHDSALLYFRWLPGYEKFRADPRWKEIEKKMGFPRDL